MPEQNSSQLASKMADLTYKLLSSCQEKQEFIAEHHGLSVSEFRCLRSFSADKVLSVKEIAERLNLTSSRLTRIIDGLVAKNFVSRDMNREDRRVIDVSLTKQGMEVVSRLNKDNLEMHGEILDTMEEKNRPLVVQALEQLSVALNTWLLSSAQPGKVSLMKKPLKKKS